MVWQNQFSNVFCPLNCVLNFDHVSFVICIFTLIRYTEDSFNVPAKPKNTTFLLFCYFFFFFISCIVVSQRWHISIHKLVSFGPYMIRKTTVDHTLVFFFFPILNDVNERREKKSNNKWERKKNNIQYNLA